MGAFVYMWDVGGGLGGVDGILRFFILFLLLVMLARFGSYLYGRYVLWSVAKLSLWKPNIK